MSTKWKDQNSLSKLFGYHFEKGHFEIHIVWEIH